MASASASHRRPLNRKSPSTAPRALPARMSRLHADVPPAVDNVLADLGLDEGGELSARATLAVKVNRLLDKQGLSQTSAAQRLGIPQSKVSAIRNYKLHGISLERLMQALIALDQRVEIVVRPGGASPDRSISVVA